MAAVASRAGGGGDAHGESPEAERERVSGEAARWRSSWRPVGAVGELSRGEREPDRRRSVTSRRADAPAKSARSTLDASARSCSTRLPADGGEL